MKNNINNQHAASSLTQRSVFAALLLAGIVHVDVARAAALKTYDYLTVTGSSTGGSYGFVTGGSYFAMDMSGDLRIQSSEKTVITSTGPIVIGVSEVATGSHTGAINGTESPVFDIWGFFGNTGMDYFRTAPTDNGDGTLNFSGWTVTWNGIPAIDMGTNAWNPLNCTALGITTPFTCAFINGKAQFSWSGVYGDPYTLYYTATVPNGDPSGFGNVHYFLHLEGTVNTIPVPASVWLFGSGLMGIIALARRRKA